MVYGPIANVYTSIYLFIQGVGIPDGGYEFQSGDTPCFKRGFNMRKGTWASMYTYFEIFNNVVIISFFLSLFFIIVKMVNMVLRVFFRFVSTRGSQIIFGTKWQICAAI